MLGTEEDFRAAVPRGARAGHAGHAGRGVQPHRQQQPLFQRRRASTRTWARRRAKDSPYYHWYRFHARGRRSTTRGGACTPCPPSTRSSRTYRDFIFGGEDCRRAALAAAAGRTAGGWTWPTSCPTTLSRASAAAMDAGKAGQLSCWARCGRTAATRSPTARRRRYLLGRETHGLMNYPFRTAAAATGWAGGDAAAFRGDAWRRSGRTIRPRPSTAP